MKSSNKLTISSPDNKKNGNGQNKRQQAAFLASEKYDQERLRHNNDFIDQLTAAQFRFDGAIADLKRKFLVSTERATRESQERADASLRDVTNRFDKKVEALTRDLDKKVLEARNKVIEPLAIFVGLFTFVSIGFQVFSQVKEYILWMPLLGIVLGGLIMFAGLVVHASSMSADASGRRKYTLAVVGMGFVITLLAGVYYQKAVEVLRVQDGKNCILVKAVEQDAKDSTYCKITR